MSHDTASNYFIFTVSWCVSVVSDAVVFDLGHVNSSMKKCFTSPQVVNSNKRDEIIVSCFECCWIERNSILLHLRLRHRPLLRIVSVRLPSSNRSSMSLKSHLKRTVNHFVTRKSIVLLLFADVMTNIARTISHLTEVIAETSQVEQYDQYTIDNDEILPVNGFRLVR